MSLLPLRRFSWTSALVVAGLLIVTVAAVSTALAARSVQTHGNAAAHALNAVPGELDASNVTAAMDSIDTADRELSAARSALASKGLRLAGAVPFAHSYIADADHLIAAATVMADAGRRVVRLNNRIDGTGGFLFWSQQIDLHTLRANVGLAKAISRKLATARADLRNVTYVPGGGSLLSARQNALTSIDHLAAPVKILRKPRTVAAALGSRHPQRYLVVARDNSVSLASGGAPVATAVVTVRDGAVGVRPGPGVDLRHRWHRVRGDAWLRTDGGSHSLADALAAPSFPVGAQEALRWADAGSRQPFDGVVSIDASGLAGLLAATGSAELPAGVSALTVPDLLAPTTALTPEAFAVRAQRILVTTLRQAVDITHATARLDALGAAAAAGHLEVFSRHPSIQSMLTQHGLGGDLPRVAQDEFGVTIAGPTEPVSATNAQQVTLDSRRALITRWTTTTLPSAATITEYAPRAAINVQLTVDGLGTAGHSVLGVHGRQAVRLRLPAGPHTLRLAYQLESPADRPTHRVYSLAMDGQPGPTSPVTVRVLTGSMHGAASDARWHRVSGGYQISLAPGSRQVVVLAASHATGFRHWVWHSGGRLVGWLVVCLVLALAGRRRIWLPLGAALGLYGCVPMAAAHWLTGIGGTGEGALYVHPATWLVLVTAIVLVLDRPREVVASTWHANRAVTLVAGGLLVDAVATALLRHSGGWSQTVQCLLAAPLVALLVLVAVRRHPGSARRAGAAILGFAVALSLLAIVEAFARRNLVYASDYDRLTWAQVFARHGFRAATTLDEPLNTGVLLVVGLALAREHLAERLRWAAMIVLLLGVVATGSRTALVIGVGYAVWSAARDRRRAKHSAPTSLARKLGFVGLAGIAAAGVLMTPPGQRLVQRALADGGSGGLRLEGLRAFASHLPQHLFIGSGVGTSEHLTRAWMHSANSAENPIIMLAVDLGVLGAAALVVATLSLAGIRWVRRPSGYQQAFLLVLAVSFGYSSFATTGVAIIMVWLFAALAHADVGAFDSLEPDMPVAPSPGPRVDRQLRHVSVPAGLRVPAPRDPFSVAPRVSAIMAARNAADTVGMAITSVLSQSYEDWELIVVDDGSSDDTAAEARAIAAQDARIRVLRYDRNVGRGAARNAALAYARGRYVAVCDADDWCRPDRFAIQVAYLDSHAEIGVLGGQVANFGPWGGPEIVYRYPTDPEAVQARLSRGHNPIPHQTVMVRRDLLQRVGGYDAACARAQDLELLLRLQAIAGMTNLDRVLVDYRHERCTTLTYWLDNGRWRRFAVARAAAAHADEPPPDPTSFHRRPAAAVAVAYDTASYVRSRYVLSRQGVRSL